MSKDNYCQSCLQILGQFISSKILDYDEKFFKSSSEICKDFNATRKCFGCEELFYPMLQQNFQPVDYIRDEPNQYEDGAINRIISAFSTNSEQPDLTSTQESGSTTSQTQFDDGINCDLIDSMKSLTTLGNYNNDNNFSVLDTIKSEEGCPIGPVGNERVDPLTIIPEQTFDDKMDFELNRGSTLYRIDDFEIKDSDIVQSTFIARDHGLTVIGSGEDESSSRELKDVKVQENFNVFSPISLNEKEYVDEVTTTVQETNEKMDLELNGGSNLFESGYKDYPIQKMNSGFSTEIPKNQNDQVPKVLSDDERFIKLKNELYADFDLVDKFIAAESVKRSEANRISQTFLPTEAQFYYNPEIKTEPDFFMAPGGGSECTIESLFNQKTNFYDKRAENPMGKGISFSIEDQSKLTAESGSDYHNGIHGFYNSYTNQSDSLGEKSYSSGSSYFRLETGTKSDHLIPQNGLVTQQDGRIIDKLPFEWKFNNTGAMNGQNGMREGEIKPIDNDSNQIKDAKPTKSSPWHYPIFSSITGGEVPLNEVDLKLEQNHTLDSRGRAYCCLLEHKCCRVFKSKSKIKVHLFGEFFHFKCSNCGCKLINPYLRSNHENKCIEKASSNQIKSKRKRPILEKNDSLLGRESKMKKQNPDYSSSNSADSIGN